MLIPTRSLLNISPLLTSISACQAERLSIELQQKSLRATSPIWTERPASEPSVGARRRDKALMRPNANFESFYREKVTPATDSGTYRPTTAAQMRSESSQETL